MPCDLRNYREAVYYLLKYHPPSANGCGPVILDIGCFVGLFVDFLKRLNYLSVWGIDIEANYIKMAEGFVRGVLRLDARDLPQYFKKDFFDIMFCIQLYGTYKSFTPHEEAAALKRLLMDVLPACRRVLKNNGIFFCKTGAPLYPQELRKMGFVNIEPRLSQKANIHILKKISRGLNGGMKDGDFFF